MSRNTSVYKRSLHLVLQFEGGYVNDPHDKGGETNKGITKATYDTYRRRKGLPLQSVRHIFENEIEDIYYNNYWRASGCEDLPGNLALVHFDWAVNSGVGRAIKSLQLVVGSQADGIIGPNTKAAVSTNLKLRGEVALCRSYCQLREGYYRSWGKGSQAQFLQGWLNRLNKVRQEVL